VRNDEVSEELSEREGDGMPLEWRNHTCRRNEVYDNSFKDIYGESSYQPQSIENREFNSKKNEEFKEEELKSIKS
jgi:hypothetical protein